jgi:hypothetical protein
MGGGGWSGTQSSNTAAIYWHVVQPWMIDGDDCAAFSGLIEPQWKPKY